MNFYSSQDRKVFVSRNTTFLEDKFINGRQSKNKVVLKEMSKSNSTSSILKHNLGQTSHGIKYIWTRDLSGRDELFFDPIDQ